MQAIKPYDPSEEDELVNAERQYRRCFTVKIKGGQRLLIWADSHRQAAAIASNTGPVAGVSPNYHAQNMTPRPEDWAQFIAQGGEQ